MNARPKNWVLCGKFGRPWGVKGQILVFWNSGTCPVEVGRGAVYTRKTGGDYVPHVVLASREHNHRSVVSISGVTNPSEAKKFTNEKIYLPEDILPALKKDEYYSYQILGLEVFTTAGKRIGEIVKIFSTGSNDVYEVKPPKGETVLIPAVKHVIMSIDLENGKMIIRLMEGMLG